MRYGNVLLTGEETGNSVTNTVKCFKKNISIPQKNALLPLHFILCYKMEVVRLFFWL